MKKHKNKHKGQKRELFDLGRLKNDDIKKEFRIKLENKFNTLEDEREKQAGAIEEIDHRICQFSEKHS